MKCIVLGLGLMSLAAVSSIGWAAESKITLKLSSIERITKARDNEDKLYISITEYSSRERPRHYVVPEYPAHWLSEHLKGIKDLVLWESLLQDKEAVTVLISLVESNAAPWIPDDLIGTVSLKATNMGKEIDAQWRLPNREHAEKLEGMQNSFLLNGEAREYHITLAVTADEPLVLEKEVKKN